MSGISRRELLCSGAALSASSLLARSAWGRAASLLSGGAGAGSAEASAAVAPREQLLFDFGWKFQFGNGCDPARDLGFGNSQGDFAKTGEFEFAKGKFDDSKWRALNLPHDWAVELPFVHDEVQSSHGYKPVGRRYPETSVGWYRRAFEIPASDLGRRIWVEFDGAFRDVLIFVNGCFIGRNNNGYAPSITGISQIIRMDRARAAIRTASSPTATTRASLDTRSRGRRRLFASEKWEHVACHGFFSRVFSSSVG